MLEELKALVKEFDAARYLGDHTDTIETALKYSDATDADDFTEYFRETYIHSAEIIYYYNAMKFLSEEDASLQESIELAQDYGYELANLNSETLATLLLQQKLDEELSGLYGLLEDYFDALEEE